MKDILGFFGIQTNSCNKERRKRGLFANKGKKICQITDVIVLEEHKRMTNRKKKKT